MPHRRYRARGNGSSAKNSASDDLKKARKQLNEQQAETAETRSQFESTLAALSDLTDAGSAVLATADQIVANEQRDLDLTRQLRDTGIAGDVDRYNSFVDQLNANRDESQRLTDDFNARVNEFNRRLDALRGSG